MMKTGIGGKESVKAQEAAKNRDRGEKREGCAIVNEVPQKINTFVKYGQNGSFPSDNMEASCSTSATSSQTAPATAGCSKDVAVNIVFAPEDIKKMAYLEELSRVSCVAKNYIADHMFNTKYGKLVLIVKCWQDKLQVIQSMSNTY